MEEKNYNDQAPYLHVEMMLMDDVNEPFRKALLRLYRENKTLFETAYGSVHNHQNWPGGYIDHVTEIMNIACVLYDTISDLRPLSFSLSDALVVLFLHDIEKPWKYEWRDGDLYHTDAFKTKDDDHAFRARKLAEYSIVLTEEMANAFQYVEGEYKDYSNRRRVMNPLAAFCHLCDVTSARIWFEQPNAKRSEDPWVGAGRYRGDES